MTYEIHIQEDSRQGHYIATLVAQQHITPTKAVEQIIDQVAQQVVKVSLVPEHEETPIELVNRLRAYKKASGRGPRPPRSTDNPEAIIGLFAGDEVFSRAMDEIIAGRPQRYGFAE